MTFGNINTENKPAFGSGTIFGNNPMFTQNKETKSENASGAADVKDNNKDPKAGI